MRNFVLCAILSLAMNGSAMQGGKLPSGTPGEQKSALIEIEWKIGVANLNCDYQFFMHIEAEEFIFTDAAGNVSKKWSDLAGAKSCHKSDATYDLDDTDVRLYDTSAVVTGRVTITQKNAEGKVTKRRSRFTDVFVWRGQWEIVASHSSRIPDTPSIR